MSAKNLYNRIVNNHGLGQSAVVENIFRRFHEGATYDARVLQFMRRGSPVRDSVLKKRVKDLSDYVRAKDDYHLITEYADRFLSRLRRIFKVPNLKLRILWNKALRLSDRTGGLNSNQLKALTRRHLNSVLKTSKVWRGFDNDVKKSVVNTLVTEVIAWGSGEFGEWRNNNNNTTPMNLNRSNSANTRKNIQWKNVRLNSLNNKNESIGGSTFQVGNKAVKLWRNHYVSLRTLRGLTKNNASNVYNMRQNAVIAKNPWTRNNILRKNIEFVKFV